MGSEHWTDRYQGLKAALEDAYAEPVWNSDRIDAIAAEMTKVERHMSTVPQSDRWVRT